MPQALQTSANIPLEQLCESPHNHRKYFDEARLQELTASVKAHGVLQPVLVRPAPKPKGKVKYELVYGHRRLRAAKLAGLKALPAMVRELDDKAALEVALIENCRREDVLPMEEADGYQELHQVHGVSVEELAERVGKSKEYVYGRLKLCELKAPAVRKALDEGRVHPSTALLVARIPGAKLQEAAAKKILEGGAWDVELGKAGPMSYRSAAELVGSEYMLQLSKAPFSVKDAQLVPEAGACGPCPKRTGNCKALYPDVKGDNVCTDPDCFGKKKAVAFKAAAAAAKENGQKLLKDSKALWGWEGKELGYRGKEKYVELTDKCPEDKKKRTFKELLGAEAPVVLARDPNGKVHQLLEKEKLAEALAAAGHSIKVKEKASAGGGSRDFEKERVEEQFRRRVVDRLMGAAVGRVGEEVTEIQALSMCARALDERTAYMRDAVARRAGCDPEDGASVARFIANAGREVLVGLLFEAIVGSAVAGTWDGYQPMVHELCTSLAVDLKALEKEQREADEASPTAKPAGDATAPEAEEED